MLRLKGEVLDEILLRRTKETRSADVQLPPRIVTVRKVSLYIHIILYIYTLYL